MMKWARRIVVRWLGVTECEVCGSDPAGMYQLLGSVHANLCTECRNRYHEAVTNWPEHGEFWLAAMDFKRIQTSGASPVDAAPVLDRFVTAERAIHDRIMDWMVSA